MGQEASRGGVPAGAIVGIVGGALAAVGSLLAWVSVSIDTAALSELVGGANLGAIPSGESGSGIEFGWEGILALVLGIAIVVLGIAAVSSASAAKSLGVVVLIAGIAAAGVAVEAMLTTQGKADDMFEEGFTQGFESAVPAGTEIPPELQAEVDRIKQAARDAISVRTGLGLYITIAGGAVALVGGLMLLGSKGPSAGMGMAGGMPGGMQSGMPGGPGAPPPPPAPPAPPTAPPAGGPGTPPGGAPLA